MCLRECGWNSAFPTPVRGFTALHVAAQEGQAKVAKLLLNHRADMAVKTINGSAYPASCPKGIPATAAWCFIVNS